MDARNYKAVETLRSGKLITIRAIRPEDSAALLEVFPELDKHSLYLRFFQNKTKITDQEIKYFTEVDFIDHVALVATADPIDKLIAGGRYFAYDHPAKIRSAEIAFMVLDRYQGQGIATLIMKHLLIIARDNRITQFEAEVLPENAKMLAVFSRTSLPMRLSRVEGVFHVSLTLSSDVTESGERVF
ncbi:MAG: N-acetyltransferase family protein [Syntrophobacteraceae bacterium]